MRAWRWRSLIDREAELHTEEEPKVNVDGIEELVADKGYHSGEALERIKEYFSGLRMPFERISLRQST
jgi:hypothetical protein